MIQNFAATKWVLEPKINLQQIW